MEQNPKYSFIDKTLFFPNEGILVVGDLHIGFEHMLRQSGVLVPERQIKDMIAELDEIFKKIKKRKTKAEQNYFSWRHKTRLRFPISRKK